MEENNILSNNCNEHRLMSQIYSIHDSSNQKRCVNIDMVFIAGNQCHDCVYCWFPVTEASFLFVEQGHFAQSSSVR